MESKRDGRYFTNWKSGNEEKFPLSCPVIKERRAFQVGNNIYRTPQAAAKKVAWSWIFMKYGGMKNSGIFCIEDIKKILDLECECGDGAEDGWKQDGCSIHDRKTGYFRRLHTRLVTHILRGWNL